MPSGTVREVVNLIFLWTGVLRSRRLQGGHKFMTQLDNKVLYMKFCSKSAHAQPAEKLYSRPKTVHADKHTSSRAGAASKARILRVGVLSSL